MKYAAKLLTFLFFLSTVLLSNQSLAKPANEPETPQPPAKSEKKPAAKQVPAAEKWEAYATDEDGSAYYYNSADIQHRKRNIVKVWVEAFYTEKNPKYTKAKFQWEIDCSKKRLRGITANATQRDGITSAVKKPSEWSPIPAESTAETLYEKVCPKKKKDAGKP